MTKRLPVMAPYSRHVLVCTGSYCSANRDGRAIYSLLASLLQREELLFSADRVKRSEAPCLGVCEGGPIVCVYPEGIWYAGVDAPFLERLVTQFLRDGVPVEERVFHRLGAAGDDAG